MYFVVAILLLLLLLVNVQDIFGMVYFGILFNRKYNWTYSLTDLKMVPSIF